MNMWGLLAAMAPNEHIQQQATMLGMLPGIGTNSSQQTSMDPGATGGTSHWENVGQRMAYNKYGYTPQQWNDLDSIIERESGWDPNAVNQSSGAYGIPQILPSAHPDANLQNDPRGQLNWLFHYINQRYGGPEQALQFKDTHGWY